MMQAPVIKHTSQRYQPVLEPGTNTRSHCVLLNTCPSSSFSRKARAAQPGHGVSYVLGSRQLRKYGEMRYRKKLKELFDRSGDPTAAAAMGMMLPINIQAPDIVPVSDDR
jgi:hypothetical protein